MLPKTARARTPAPLFALWHLAKAHSVITEMLIPIHPLFVVIQRGISWPVLYAERLGIAIKGPS